MRRRTRLLGPIAIVLGLGLCGAGPACEGTEVEGTAGIGWFEQERGGCGGSPTYLYRTQHIGGQARIRHRFRGTGGLLSASFGATHLKDVADRLVDPGTDNPTDPAAPEYESGGLFLGTLRGGWQWSWLGGELGFIWGGLTGHDLGNPAPSGVIWFVPVDGLHLYVSLLEDPAVFFRGLVRVGVGYAFDRWSFGLSLGSRTKLTEGGVAPADGVNGTLEAEVRIAEAWFVGLGASIASKGVIGPNLSLFGSFRYVF